MIIQWLYISIIKYQIIKSSDYIQANIYLFKVNNSITKRRSEICSKLTIRTQERRLSRIQTECEEIRSKPKFTDIFHIKSLLLEVQLMNKFLVSSRRAISGHHAFILCELLHKSLSRKRYSKLKSLSKVKVKKSKCRFHKRFSGKDRGSNFWFHHTGHIL